MKPIKCCGRKFEDAGEYRRHGYAHIESIIIKHARRALKINLPYENWRDIFEHFNQEKLQYPICHTQRLFHAIARQILDGPPGRILPVLGFVGSTWMIFKDYLYKRVVDGEGKVKVEGLTIAKVPPPDNVIGISLIELKIFNAKVLSFLCLIRHLFEDIHLGIGAGLSGVQWKKKKYRYSGGSRCYHCGHKSDSESDYSDGEDGDDECNLAVLELLLRVFPRQELSITNLEISSGLGSNGIGIELLGRLLSNVRSLRIECSLPGPEMISLSNPNAHCSPYVPVLVNWLHTPPQEGQQKLASLDLQSTADFASLGAQAKEHFLCAESAVPVAYFVRIHSWPLSHKTHVELPFDQLHNERTGEVLVLRRCKSNSEFVLYRRSGAPFCPSPDNEEEPELVEVERIFSTEISEREPRNKLVLNIAQMSTEEWHLPFEKDESTKDGAEEKSDGPSNAKKPKLDDGE